MQLKTTTAIFCAFLTLPGVALAQGSGNDAAQSGGSDPNLAAAGCGANFSVTDADGDGAITRQEFEGWQVSSFAALDDDGNGELSRAEYVNCLSASEEEADLELSGDRDSDTMAAADTDNSDSLSPEEYRTAARDAQGRAQSGNPQDIILLRRFILVPANFSDSDVGAMSANDVAANASRQFRTLDTDRSGDVSEQEWSADHESDEGAKPWLNAEFDAMDSDSSGTLSEDEFKGYNYERWSSAETTAAIESGTQTSASGSDSSESASNETTEGSDPQTPVIFYYYFEEPSG